MRHARTGGKRHQIGLAGERPAPFSQSGMTRRAACRHGRQCRAGGTCRSVGKAGNGMSEAGSRLTPLLQTHISPLRTPSHHPAPHGPRC
jgi:hypothetical protein